MNTRPAIIDRLAAVAGESSALMAHWDGQAPEMVEIDTATLGRLLNDAQRGQVPPEEKTKTEQRIEQLQKLLTRNSNQLDQLSPAGRCEFYAAMLELLDLGDWSSVVVAFSWMYRSLMAPSVRDDHSPLIAVLDDAIHGASLADQSGGRRERS